MWRGLALLLLVTGFSGSPARARLDGPGRAMLDPARAQALAPAALIAHLALRPDAQVADVGAGPGWLSLPLARAVPRGRVIATDIRPDYLAVAANRARAAKIHNVETRVVAADDPGLAPSSIDLAFLCQVDAYLPDRAHYLEKLVPTLRPGGRIAVVSQPRHRAALLAAARRAGLVLMDDWSPSPVRFLLVFGKGHS